MGYSERPLPTRVERRVNRRIFSARHPRCETDGAFTVARLILGGLLLSLAVSAPHDLQAAEKIAVKLSVRDALTVPGRPVMIEARLVQDSLLNRIGIGGEPLEFLVAGKPIGMAMTGGDGRAFLEYMPRMRGNQPVTVRVAGSKRVQSAEASGLIASWERRRPILLVEITALQEEKKSPVLPFPAVPGVAGSLSPPNPLPGAAEELKRLTDFYFNVIYLSRSGGPQVGAKEDEDIRAWLRQHGFPFGLSVVISPEESALADKIEDMRKQGWDNLKAGVGRTKEFAEVLVAHRMQVVIVPEPDRGELPKKAQTAKDWKEVRKKLQE